LTPNEPALTLLAGAKEKMGVSNLKLVQERKRKNKKHNKTQLAHCGIMAS